MNELLWLTIFTSACQGQPFQYQTACGKAMEATTKQVGWYQEVAHAETVLTAKAETKARRTVGASIYEKTTVAVIAGLTLKRFHEGKKISLKMPNPVYNNVYVEGMKNSGSLIVRFDF